VGVLSFLFRFYCSAEDEAGGEVIGALRSVDVLAADTAGGRHVETRLKIASRRSDFRTYEFDCEFAVLRIFLQFDQGRLVSELSLSAQLKPEEKRLGKKGMLILVHPFLTALCIAMPTSLAMETQLKLHRRRDRRREDNADLHSCFRR